MEGSSHEDHAGILPLHLRDAESREVQVHVYYTSFHGRDDSPCHIVGIAEAAAPEGVAGSAPERSVRDTVPTTIERHPWASEGTESSDSRFTLETVSGSELGEIAVTVEDGPGLSIISCTPGFTNLCGPVGGDAQLADWLVDRNPFERSVQNYVSTFREASLDLGAVVLRTPAAANAGVTCVVNECKVDGIRTIYDDDRACVAFALRMRFNGVRRVLHKKERQTSRRAANACMAKARPGTTKPSLCSL